MGLLNKQILSIICFNETITFHLDDGSRFEIYTTNSFWRLSLNNEILVTFDDFSARSFGSICQIYGPNCWPMSNIDEIEDSMDDLNEDEKLESLFDEMESHIDIVSGTMMNALEGQTIIEATEFDNGDLTILLNNNAKLEIYIACATSKGKQHTYRHMS